MMSGSPSVGSKESSVGITNHFRIPKLKQVWRGEKEEKKEKRKKCNTTSYFVVASTQFIEFA